MYTRPSVVADVRFIRFRFPPEDRQWQYIRSSEHTHTHTHRINAKG